MNVLQQNALNCSMLPSFTDEDAKHVLNWYYGSSPIIVADGASICVGVVKAIEKLGGKYQAQWGVTKLPNYVPKDEV